jgi:pimeloyl-ACP methyl ester carboxylesterase
MYKKVVPFLCACLLVALTVRSQQDYSSGIEPQPEETFSYARFDLRVLAEVTTPRLILLLLPGFESDGAWLLDDAFWHEFAMRHQALLMAGTLKALPENQRKRGYNYNLADRGSGRALLDALADLEIQSGLPGLSRLPLLLWGHSAGGQFNYGFACFRPEQVLGYCAIKGGFYPMEPQEETRRVPALFLAGEKDEPHRRDGLQKVFMNLSEGGKNPASFVVEPNSGHGVDQCNLLIKPFFDALVDMRLPGNDPVSYDRMKPINPAEQGVFVTLENDAVPSWFPNRHVAEIFLQFVQGSGSPPATDTDSP